MKWHLTISRFIRREDGAAALEFAIVGPVLVVVLMGICGYGGYFWLSHAVQQTANDAARAAMGGLDAAERTLLANAVLAQEIDDYAWLKLANASTTVTGDTNTLTVRVTYNAADTPFWSMKGLVPMPSSTIARSATVRLGGY